MSHNGDGRTPDPHKEQYANAPIQGRRQSAGVAYNTSCPAIVSTSAILAINARVNWRIADKELSTLTSLKEFSWFCRPYAVKALAFLQISVS